MSYKKPKVVVRKAIKVVELKHRSACNANSTHSAAAE